MKPVKEELNRMVKLGVISQVTEPTEWCAGMVPVVKRNGSVRVCVDLTHLNQSVKRERHQLPLVEQVLGPTDRSEDFFKVRCQFGLLADSTCIGLGSSDNVHYSIRKIPIS